MDNDPAQTEITALLAAEDYDRAAVRIQAFLSDRAHPELVAETVSILEGWLAMTRANRAHIAHALGRLTSLRQYCSRYAAAEPRALNLLG